MDSMQIYRELKLGTASPSAEELAAAPHHLYNAFSVREPLNCATYAECARRVMVEIQRRGRTPLLVGGTGLYLRTLFEGLDDVPATEPALRARIDRLGERRGRLWLHRMLQRLDPESAREIHPHNRQRVQRALEVRIQTGRGIRDFWRERDSLSVDALPLVIGLRIERDLLHRKINENVEKMLKRGWLNEVQALMDAGLADAAERLGPIGYREARHYLEGALSWGELLARVATATRRYAKRQMTWFRKVNYIRWFTFDPTSGYNVGEIASLMKHTLGLATFIPFDHTLNR